MLVVFGDLKEDLDSMFGNDVCVAFVKRKDKLNEITVTVNNIKNKK